MNNPIELIKRLLCFEKEEPEDCHTCKGTGRDCGMGDSPCFDCKGSGLQEDADWNWLQLP